MSNESKEEGRPDNLDVIRELLRKLEEVASSDGPAAGRLEQVKGAASHGVHHGTASPEAEAETSQPPATRSVPDKSTALTKSIDTDDARSLTSLQRTGSPGPMQLPSLPEIHPPPARLERVTPKETPHTQAAAPRRRSPVIAVMSFMLGVTTAAGAFIFFEPLKRMAQQGFDSASRKAGTENVGHASSQSASKPVARNPGKNEAGPASVATTTAIAVPAGDNGQAIASQAPIAAQPELPDGKPPASNSVAAGGKAEGAVAIGPSASPNPVSATAIIAPRQDEQAASVSAPSTGATMPVAEAQPTLPAATPAATVSSEPGQPAPDLKAPVDAAAASAPQVTAKAPDKAPDTAQVSSAGSASPDQKQASADSSAAKIGAGKQPQAEPVTQARQSTSDSSSASDAERPVGSATTAIPPSEGGGNAEVPADGEKPKVAALASQHTSREREPAQGGLDAASRPEIPAEPASSATGEPSANSDAAQAAARDAKSPQVDQAEGRQQASSSAIQPPSPRPAVRPPPAAGVAAPAFALSLPDRVVVPVDGQAIFEFGLQPRPARTDQLLIVVRRLPDAATFSKGSAIGNGIWLLPAEEAHGVYMIAREKAVSGIEIDVELATLGGKVLSRGTTRVDLGPSVAETRKLIARARLLIDTGELEMARQLLRESAEAGSPAAAFELALTYDPGEVDRLGIPSVAADERLARTHYERARQLGSQDAAARLHGSGSR